jgi:hypothetical protein
MMCFTVCKVPEATLVAHRMRFGDRLGDVGSGSMTIDHPPSLGLLHPYGRPTPYSSKLLIFCQIE